MAKCGRGDGFVRTEKRSMAPSAMEGKTVGKMQPMLNGDAGPTGKSSSFGGKSSLGEEETDESACRKKRK